MHDILEISKLIMHDILEIRKFIMHVVKQFYVMILIHVLLSLYSVLLCTTKLLSVCDCIT